MRTNWKTVSTLVTMALLSGCMDRSISAPESAGAPASMMMAPQGAPQLSLIGGNLDNTSTDFTVNGKQGGVFLVGNHAVVIPAGGICDPAKSSYGPGTWDDACTPLKGNLKIHADIRTSGGRTWVDFTPALRFVPSDNASEWAYMVMFTPGAKKSKDLSRFTIYYSSAIGALGIDESLEDATLRTYVDKSSGISLRRIKHFSGYNAAGQWVEGCIPGVDRDCYDSPGNGVGGGGQ